MTCKMCREHYKSVRPAHFGSDPRCAFPDGGPFTSDNWQCVTANAVRDLVESKRDGVVRDWSAGGDQSNAIVRLDNDYEYVPDGALALYVTWYKSRGRTGGMWLMSDERSGTEECGFLYDFPRPPTEAEVLAIIEHYATVSAEQT